MRRNAIQKLIKDNGGPRKFAEECGIPRRTVEKWARGERIPTPWTAQNLKDAIRWRRKKKMEGGAR